jgi:hypothetical protein
MSLGGVESDESMMLTPRQPTTCIHRMQSQNMFELTLAFLVSVWAKFFFSDRSMWVKVEHQKQTEFERPGGRIR